MNEETSEGIVLRCVEYSDKKRILTLFTPERGVIPLIIKNLSSKNPSHLALTSPFCQAEFHFRQGRSDLLEFVDASIIDDHSALRRSWGHLKAAGELAGALLHSQLPGKPAPALYALLLAYLKHLFICEDPTPLTISFYLKVLKHEGLLSLEKTCSRCGSPSAQYLHQGESFCSSHAIFEALFFTLEEWQILYELIEARQFSLFSSLKIPQDVKLKIQAHFNELAKQ